MSADGRILDFRVDLGRLENEPRGQNGDDSCEFDRGGKRRCGRFGRRLAGDAARTIRHFRLLLRATSVVGRLDAVTFTGASATHGRPSPGAPHRHEEREEQSENRSDRRAASHVASLTHG